MKKYLIKIILIALIIIPFKFASAASLTTLSATFISSSGAYLTAIGSGLPNNPDEKFTGGFRYTTTPAGSCGSMTNYSSVSATITDGGAGFAYLERNVVNQMSPNTLYYFCAFMRHNATGVYLFGNILSFTTNGNTGTGGSGSQNNPAFGTIGDIVTLDPSNFSDTGTEATLRGSASGVSGSIFGYFRYATMEKPPIFCNDIYGSNMRSVQSEFPFKRGTITNGEFRAQVTELTPNTTYYYCATGSNHAEYPTKIKYGEVKSFRTPPCKTCPHSYITTNPALVLGGTSATLLGSFGTSKGITTYFEYKNSEQPGDWIKTTEKQYPKNTYGKMEYFIPKGLIPDTSYIFRAVGKTTDPDQIFYGNELIFKTRTMDGFGDGEGWVFDGETPFEIIDFSGTNIDFDIDNDGTPDQYDPYTPCDPASQNCGNGDGFSGNNDGFGNFNAGDLGGFNAGDFGLGDNFNNNDLDLDGILNSLDLDADGDGIINMYDTDDDNDGIFDASDSTPLGFGSTINDLDGDGIPNLLDEDDDGDGIPDINDPTPLGTGYGVGDLDGDGIGNSLDDDIDGDGIPNAQDPDDDNDGAPDNIDKSPIGIGYVGSSGGGGTGGGPGGGPTTGEELGIGDTYDPPIDAIVRYREGVETVFIRQIMRNDALAKKYGWTEGEDRQAFANYLAHFFGRHFGYVAKNGKEVRVRYPDVAAYELREVGNKTTVYESFENKETKKFGITGIRSLNSLFKIIFKYEYYFLKKR